ncbi:hypothetical protein [Breoghania sp.]|uniref:hypothetical protein n=1 Tax=Breoghania sp. TaxID=2065378 RepID=UPI002AA73517|nr:hypothetical protein [Breoghania sp.]
MDRKSETDIREIDVVSYAAHVGQTAAAAIARLLGPQDADWFDPALWASGGEIVSFRGDDSGEAAVLELASYALGRGATVPGEQLFRKAGEYGVHWGGAWGACPFWMRTAYEQFAAIVRQVGLALLHAQGEAERAARRAAPSARQLDIEDSIFETRDGYGAREQVMVDALAATRPPYTVPTEQDFDTTGEDDDAPMSAGERPVRHSGGKRKAS